MVAEKFTIVANEKGENDNDSVTVYETYPMFDDKTNYRFGQTEKINSELNLLSRVSKHKQWYETGLLDKDRVFPLAYSIQWHLEAVVQGGTRSEFGVGLGCKSFQMLVDVANRCKLKLASCYVCYNDKS